MIPQRLILIMNSISASEYNYQILCMNDTCEKVHPLLRDINGSKLMYLISPHHGRSYVMSICNDKYIVSKGNGLSYTQHGFLNSGEFGDDTWGLLLRKDAIRDYNLGFEISDLGIKTNTMEWVVELETDIILPNMCRLHPILLQYSVECPYRICDTAYMTRDTLFDIVKKWPTSHKFNKPYLIAADILVHNLRTLHDNQILHNAIHPQNYTWALELLDFELSCSPQYPYDSDDDRRHAKELFTREIIQTYDIINHIAWSLNEQIDYSAVDNIFDEYGFNLSSLKV